MPQSHLMRFPSTRRIKFNPIDDTAENKLHLQKMHSAGREAMKMGFFFAQKLRAKLKGQGDFTSPPSPLVFRYAYTFLCHSTLFSLAHSPSGFTLQLPSPLSLLLLPCLTFPHAGS